MDQLLSIDQLRLLDHLLAGASVSAAAKALDLSQPSISIQLRKLRARLNDPLFVRSGNRLLPTPLATSMREPVRQALAAVARIGTPPQVFSPLTSTRSFRLTMTDASQITLLPRLLGMLQERATSLTLAVNLIGPTLEEDLREGRVDLALGYLPALRSGIIRQRLFRQDWVCLLGAETKQQSLLTIARYRAGRHVEVESGTGSALLKAGLKKAEIERHVALTLPGFLGLSSLLATSDLIATVPRHTGQTLARTSNLSVEPCPFAIEPFSVYQYWHERNEHDPGHRWLRQQCHALFDADYVVSDWVDPLP